MFKDVKFSKELLDSEYSDVCWIEHSGLNAHELEKEFDRFLVCNADLSVALQKAKLFELICTKAQIAVDENNIFQDKLNHCSLINRKFTFKRRFGETGIWDGPLKELHKLRTQKSAEGFWDASEDFGHVCSNWQRLLNKGFSGILQDIDIYLAKPDISLEQREFYTTCQIYYKSIIKYIERLADEAEKNKHISSTALRSIACGAPRNMYEALHTIFIYFSLHEFTCGARNRTLGRLDKLLYNYYKNDIETGTFTQDEIRLMLRFFMYKLWLSKVNFDQPLMLGGMDAEGKEVTNELSHIIVEEYDELDIHSPKIHIRVSPNTPDDFLKKVLRCIRNGHSSFLVVNDMIAVKSLMNVGLTEAEAKEYILIGCYEPAAFGCEIPCTGNASFNSVKALQLALSESPDTLDMLYAKTMQYIEQGLNDVMKVICAVEDYYMDMYPDPMLSATFESCMENGRDAYDCGAKYNNSSITVAGIATVIDSLAIINKFVNIDRRITMAQLKEAIEANWIGYEQLRAQILNSDYRYGNNCEYADNLAKKFSKEVASMINNKPNARGGVFKAGLFSVDYNVKYGLKTAATPDGRKDGDAISKNLCPTSGKEYGGITTLINSVGKLDTWLYPNGSVLDIVLHPSAVAGDDGLTAMLGLYKAYFANGGFAMHGNVFNPEDLKKAQENPDDYKNLQVRVCGWNAYFVNLTKAEQDEFIKQAEAK